MICTLLIFAAVFIGWCLRDACSDHPPKWPWAPIDPTVTGLFDQCPTCGHWPESTP